jgi:hypothetical protein
MPEWLLQTLVLAGLIGLAAAIWRAHEKRDEERFNALWDQIGRDSKSGMREVVHRTANEMSWVEPEVDDLKARVERLEDDK